MINKARILLLLAPLCFLAPLGFPALAVAEEKDAPKPIVMGWVERAILFPSKVPFLAKLDTGAKTTSINAQDVKRYENEGKEWVRFTVRNSKGVSSTFDLPIFKIAKIRRTGVASVERIVVKLKVCMGPFKTEAQVNLANRQNMRYQLLIGRRLMEGRIYVDSGKRFLVTPQCD